MKRMKIKRSIKMYSCLSLCLFLVAALLPQTAAAKEPGTPDVRVGWYEDAYNITGEHGERSGYGYEYQQSVAAYTGWTYEYVSSGWAELLELMKNGEIDLMGGVSYTDERAKTMLYSELPMGEEKIKNFCIFVLTIEKADASMNI